MTAHTAQFPSSVPATLEVMVTVDVPEALRRGYAARKQQTIALEVPALSAEDRDLVARYLREGDGRRNPRGWYVGRPKYSSSFRSIITNGVLQISEPTVDGLLSALRAAHAAEEEQAHADQAEREAMRAQKAAERAAEVERARTAPVEALVEKYPGVLGQRWGVRDRDVAEEAGRLEEAEAEANRRNAADLAEAAAAAAERVAWIEAHGSERLRRLLAEGIEHEAVYRDERLAAEMPGWRYEVESPGTATAPRNPPARALEMLDEARRSAPDAELVYWTAEILDEDDHGAPQFRVVRGYTARASFLGRSILWQVGDDGTPPVNA